MLLGSLLTSLMDGRKDWMSKSSRLNTATLLKSASIPSPVYVLVCLKICVHVCFGMSECIFVGMCECICDGMFRCMCNSKSECKRNVCFGMSECMFGC